MKRIMASLLLAVGLAYSMAGPAGAESFGAAVPTDQRGQQLHPLWGGAQYYAITTAAEHFISSKTCVLMGVITSTGATTAWLVFRDTDTANQSASRVIDRLAFTTAADTVNTAMRLPFPVLFKKGMTAELSSTGSGERATILYRELK